MDGTVPLVKKRGIEEMDHSPNKIMTLLKRMHLDKTSELFAKPFVSSPRGGGAGSKRNRLPPIQEVDSVYTAKRRRVDSEMADKMSSSLWISAKRERLDATSSDHMADQVADEISSDEITNVNVNVDMGARRPSLEQAFISNHIREQNLQLALWVAPKPIEQLLGDHLLGQLGDDKIEEELDYMGN